MIYMRNSIAAFTCVFTFLMWSMATFAQDAEKNADKVFNAQSFTLDNGLQVVLVENHRAPIVSHMMWYRVGGADDPPAHSGLAHMFEHIMFRGSENVPPGEYSKRIRALGGEDNAFTSYDYTAYYANIASEYLEDVMRMEADRIQGLVIDGAEFASEQKVVMEERRLRTDNDPRNRFYEQLGYNLYPHHPYGIPLIGWMSEIADLTTEDAHEFYKKWYAPNNAILVVSGDITLEKLKSLATKYYGPLTRQPYLDALRQRPPIVDFHGEYDVNYTHARIQQPQLVRMVRVPSVREDRDMALALQLLEDVLGSGSTTRLYKSLVVEQKLASEAGINVNNATYDAGQAYLYATPRDGISLEDLNAALLVELKEILEEGITEEEVLQSKDRMIAQAVFARDSVSGPAMIIGRGLTSGLTLDEIEYWVRDVQNITTEQVNEAARRYLLPDPAHNLILTGYMRPEAVAEEENLPAEEAP
jgi:zinc protease